MSRVRGDACYGGFRVSRFLRSGDSVGEVQMPRAIQRVLTPPVAVLARSRWAARVPDWIVGWPPPQTPANEAERRGWTYDRWDSEAAGMRRLEPGELDRIVSEPGAIDLRAAAARLPRPER